jgi:hypothetical protein
MPELKGYNTPSPEKFYDDLLYPLAGKEKDVRMLYFESYGGIGKGDLPFHEQLRDKPWLVGAVLDGMEQAVAPIAHGIPCARMRIMPEVGQNGATAEEIGVEFAYLSAAAAAGEDTQFAWSNQARRLRAAFPNSQTVKDYLEGMNNGVSLCGLRVITVADEIVLARVVDHMPDDPVPETMNVRIYDLRAEEDKERYQEILQIGYYAIGLHRSTCSFDIETARRIPQSRYPIFSPEQHAV